MKKKISQHEWNEVTGIAVSIFDRMESGLSCDDEVLRLKSKLVNLTEIYPEDSRSFSSLADFSDGREKQEFYEKAHSLARRVIDVTEQVSIVTSALRDAFEIDDRSEVLKWGRRLSILSRNKLIKDEWEQKEALVLLEKMNSRERQKGSVREL